VSGRQRASRLAWGLLLLGVLAVAFVARDVVLESPIRTCPAWTVTDRPCALCGLSRAFACAAGGELREATRLNPGWAPTALALALAGLTCLWDAAFATDRLGPWLRWSQRHRWWLVGALVALSVARAIC